ncbi:hypothetical protein MA16_Dca007278 [Dendrobium catenatum]|uniref:Uncharacterized protein n=1 Tax=Dendrobium catenatum TaxID=906689 RepID=A0A2I0W6J8_9ASPA|nr:hypothetical protein MA16_Dca007278 [Dendrobium catenatum]
MTIRSNKTTYRFLYISHKVTKAARLHPRPNSGAMPPHRRPHATVCIPPDACLWPRLKPKVPYPLPLDLSVQGRLDRPDPIDPLRPYPSASRM